MYKALDGQQDWRPVLLEVLDGWLRLFQVPEVTIKNKGRARQAFVWVRNSRPAEVGVAATSELNNIAPCEALQAVDRTGRLPSRAPCLWLLPLLLSIQ